MATSGTATFDLDLAELVEEAFERAGSELRSGYDMRTARRSLNILLSEWANRGINMWTMDSGVIPLIAGTSTYSLPTDTVDVFEHVIRTGAGVVATQADMVIARISAPVYAAIPSKLAPGRPIQVWVQRLSTPQITVWPVPDASSTYQFVYWRLRRLQDAGNGSDTQDIPFRFLPAMAAGLAYHLALKLPNGLERLPFLKAQYDEAFELAALEDREKSPFMLVPRMSRG
jgi:hypothetical protein